MCLHRAMTSFRIHPRLQADSHALGRLDLSHVLLHRNAAVPWFILVPEVDVIELCDLTRDQRAHLDAEIDTVSRLLRERFTEVTKLNVAAIGNLVPQLHVHVIGRYPNDPCWPQPVWGHLQVQREWDDAQVQELVTRIAAT